jgi:ankyrin repeat protein
LELQINQNSAERTPLLHALTSPVSTKSTFVLIENGADVNARSRLGNTPLQAAAVSGAPEDLIETLLKHGARVNDRNTGIFVSLN